MIKLDRNALDLIHSNEANTVIIFSYRLANSKQIVLKYFKIKYDFTDFNDIELSIFFKVNCTFTFKLLINILFYY